MQYQGLTGPLQQNDAAPFSPEEAQGNHPDQSRPCLSPQAGILWPIDGLPPFSSEMAGGYHPDRPVLGNSRSQNVAPVDIVVSDMVRLQYPASPQLMLGPKIGQPFFDNAFIPPPPETSTGYQPAQPRFRTTPLGYIIPPIEVQVIDLIYVSRPDSPRLYLPPQNIYELAQVAHQPETSCKAEEIQGYHPDQPRLFIAKEGSFVYSLDLLVFGPEMAQGNFPAQPRLSRGVRIALPDSQITPVSQIGPEVQGVHPDRPQLSRALQIRLPVGNENHIPAPLDRVDMFAGQWPNRPRLFEYTHRVPTQLITDLHTFQASKVVGSDKHHLGTIEQLNDTPIMDSSMGPL